MTKRYFDEFLISELQRFYKENGRVPKYIDMTPKNGYPAAGAYYNHFRSFNNALIIAEFKPNRKYHIGTLDGSEVCSYCGKKANEIPNFEHWRYNENNIRYCSKHGQNSDYVKGELNISSETGLGRAGEILVVKTLGIGKEHDCNRISCGYSFDMYHEDYGRIDVKTSLFSYKYNRWQFAFNKKKISDTYICIGLSNNRKTVEYVWIVHNEHDIKSLTSFFIYDTQHSLSNREHWEVLNKPYNDVWQEMIVNYQNGGCKIFK